MGLLQNSQTQETVTKPIKQDWKGAGGLEPGLQVGSWGFSSGNFCATGPPAMGEAGGLWPYHYFAE